MLFSPTPEVDDFGTGINQAPSPEQGEGMGSISSGLLPVMDDWGSLSFCRGGRSGGARAASNLRLEEGALVLALQAESVDGDTTPAMEHVSDGVRIDGKRVLGTTGCGRTHPCFKWLGTCWEGHAHIVHDLFYDRRIWSARADGRCGGRGTWDVHGHGRICLTPN